MNLSAVASGAPPVIVIPAVVEQRKQVLAGGVGG